MGLLGLCCRRRAQGHPGGRRAPVEQIEAEPEPEAHPDPDRGIASWRKISRKRREVVPLQIDQDGTVSDRSVTVSWSDDSPRSVESALWGIERSVKGESDKEIIPKSLSRQIKGPIERTPDHRQRSQGTRSIPGDRTQVQYPEN